MKMSRYASVVGMNRTFETKRVIKGWWKLFINKPEHNNCYLNSIQILKKS